LRRTDWSHIHEANGFHLYTIPLSILSILYGIVVRIRNLALKNRGKRLPGFVLSIGNITTGGTGKTPAVIMVARWAKAQGYRVAVLSRGYGGKIKKGVQVVSDGRDILLSPEISGDEPWLIAKNLKGVPVVCSPSRYLAGLEAKSRFDTDFFILDDGFQHIALERDLDIVLADTKSPFGNMHLLPWGPLREPISGLRRADIMLFTRSEGISTLYNGHHITGKPVFTGNHMPEKIISPSSGQEFDLSTMRGKSVIAFSGIGRPESFRKSLADLGVKILSFTAFGDHYPFSRRDLIKLEQERRSLNGDMLITTEKDWARIRGVTADTGTISLLAIEFVIAPDKKAFFSIIKEKVEKNRPLEPGYNKRKSRR
jgi:tetraacyldisaccharide 4'-kinase